MISAISITLCSRTRLRVVSRTWRPSGALKSPIFRIKSVCMKVLLKAAAGQRRPEGSRSRHQTYTKLLHHLKILTWLYRSIDIAKSRVKIYSFKINTHQLQWNHTSLQLIQTLYPKESVAEISKLGSWSFRHCARKRETHPAKTCLRLQQRFTPREWRRWRRGSVNLDNPSSKTTLRIQRTLTRLE